MYSSDPDWTGKPLDSIPFKYGKGTGDNQFSEKLSGILNGWSLVKTSSSDFLFREVRKTAYTNIAVGIGVVILGLLMINLISFKVTRPIKLLSRKVRKIEGENLNIQLKGTREDEIGHLETHIQDMMHRINLHIEHEYRLELENKTNQFRALVSQINPHFLNNALQSIGAVAIRTGSPDVYKLVTPLSKMMRYTIRSDHWATVRSEAEYVESYLNLQKERFRTTFDCKIDIEGAILEVPVPAMILQPLVENYFKHCYEEGWQGTGLSINGTLVGEQTITEGVGIASPLLKERPTWRTFLLLAIVAGSPAIIGTWIGGFVFNDTLAALFFGIGAGAIVQVIYVISKMIIKEAQKNDRPAVSWVNLASLTLGIVLMYVTALFVSV